MLQHAIATLSLPFYTHREKVLRISTHILIPTIALGFIAFAIFSTVYPVPSFPFNLPAYIIIGWIVIGALVISMVGTHKMGKKTPTS